MIITNRDGMVVSVFGGGGVDISVFDHDHQAANGQQILAVDGPGIGDYYINGIHYPNPGQFYLFDPTGKTWVYNAQAARTEMLRRAQGLERTQVMDVFPDAARAQKIRDNFAAYRAAVNKAQFKIEEIPLPVLPA